METLPQLIYPDTHAVLTDAYDFREAAIYFGYVFPLNPHAFGCVATL